MFKKYKKIYRFNIYMMSKIIYKVIFDVKQITLHNSIEWLKANNIDLTNIDFTFNNNYYTFKDSDYDHLVELGYIKRLEMIDCIQNIIICYLYPPIELINTELSHTI